MYTTDLQGVISDIKEGTNNWAWESPFARYVRLEYGVIFACW